MEYAQEILQNLEDINNVFKSLGQKVLLENDDFQLGEISHSKYIQLIRIKEGSIGLLLTVDMDGVYIGLDRESEVFMWSNANINNYRLKFIDTLRIIFTHTICVKYCGENYTKFYFLDSSQNVKLTASSTSGLYWPWGCQTKTFSPMYRI